MTQKQELELPTFAELIQQYCDPSRKGKRKFICPVCGGDDLSIHKSEGKWNCFNDGSPQHRGEICNWLNARLREDDPNAFGPDDRWADKRYQKSILWRKILCQIDELNYFLWNSVDPEFGVTEEDFWKDFIAWLRRENINLSVAIGEAESRVLKQCPESLKRMVS